MENMKKKVLFIGLFLAAIVAVSFQFNSRKENLESLMLENIDALASGEWNTNPRCFGTGSVDCPSSDVKVEYVVGLYGLEELY